MINKKNFLYLPRINTEQRYLEQKSILKKNNLPINLCESLSTKKIQKFKKLFLSVTKKKQEEKQKSRKNHLISINGSESEKSSKINNNYIKLIEDNKKITKKNSIINTETELKINKLMDIFNTEKEVKKNSFYDLIKGKMFKKLKNHLVLKEPNYNTIFENNDDYSTVREQKEFFLKKKYDLLSKKKLNIITESTPKLFNNERITRRFEDMHMTPEEFLNENFTKEEIEIMIKNVNYFKLNKEPLKEWDLNVNLTLKDSLNKEDELSEKKIKEKLRLNEDNDIIKNMESKGASKNNNYIISEKYLKTQNYSIPKLDLKFLDFNDNVYTEEANKKSIKQFKFLINPKNKLLYKVPTICSRYKRHIRMNNNLTDRNQISKDFYRKTIYKIRSNLKHIERFENKQIQKNEFLETQNILNEIKSNYMKQYHDKVTQDNIKKNKIKFNDKLKINKTKSKKKIKSYSQYVRIGKHDQILLSERLWK